MWVWAKHYQPYVNRSLNYYRETKGGKLKLPSAFFNAGYDTYIGEWDDRWRQDKHTYARYGKLAKWRWKRNKHILPYSEWLKHARKYATINRRRYLAQQKRKKILNKQ